MPNKSDPPVLVGQRIKSVRRLTVKEQNELAIEMGWQDFAPSRQGPVVVELDNGVMLIAHAGITPGALWGRGQAQFDWPFEVQPSGVEVNG